MMTFPMPPPPPSLDFNTDMTARWAAYEAEHAAWQRRCGNTQIVVGSVILAGILVAGPAFVMLVGALAP